MTETTIVASIIKKDKKYLLVQQNNPIHARGLWGIPGGHVEKGESLEEAAVREVKEETNLDVEIIKQLGVWPRTKGGKYVGFAAKLIGGEIRLDKNELSDSKWCTPEEINEVYAQNKFRDEWIYQAILKAK